MAVDILTMGDCITDIFMKVDASDISSSGDPEHPKICFYHGSKIHVSEVSTNIGGNAFNVAMGVRKLGLSTAIYSEIGDDNNGNKVIEALKEKRIRTSMINQKGNKESNVCSILAFGHDRTLFSYHGKRNYKFPNITKKKTPKIIYYTSMGDGFKRFQTELLDFLSLNKTTLLALNPGTIQLKNGKKDIEDVLKVVDILFVNKEEAMKLTEISSEMVSLEQLHKELRALGPKLTVITDNINGSSASDGTKFEQIVISKVLGPIRDKTGAGDAYAAGFIAAVSYGKNLRTAMQWGAKNAASVITEVGATNGILTKLKIES